MLTHAQALAALERIAEDLPTDEDYIALYSDGGIRGDQQERHARCVALIESLMRTVAEAGFTPGRRTPPQWVIYDHQGLGFVAHYECAKESHATPDDLGTRRMQQGFATSPRWGVIRPCSVCGGLLR